MSVRLAVFLLGCLLTETLAANHVVSTSVYHLRKLLEIGYLSGCEDTTIPNNSGVYIETCKIEPKTGLSCTDLDSEPAEQPCQCCFVCRLNPDCQAWVHRTDTMRCYYKRASYDACTKVKCDTCVASNPSSASFYTCTKRVTEEKKWRRSEASSKPSEMASLEELKESAGDSKYGKGVLVGETSTPNICCFDEGFDQPAEFNLLEKPLILTTSFDCCNACRQNSMCKSWIWKKATFECFLKTQYVESRNKIPCASCFAYKSSSSKYFYIEKKRSKGHAGEEKYTEEVKTYSGVYHEGQTGTTTEQSKTPSPYKPTYRTPSRSPYRSPSYSRSPYRSPSFSRSPYRSPTPSRPTYRSPSPSPSGRKDDYGELTLTVYHKAKAGEKERKEETIGKGFGERRRPYPSPSSSRTRTPPSKTSGTSVRHQGGIQRGRKGRTTGTGRRKEESGSTFQKETYHCPYICNYDQPTEYDMFPEPFEFDRPEHCCQKYHETEGKTPISLSIAFFTVYAGCVSWVYHKKTKRCHLKSEYHPEESTIPCADCIAYYETKPTNAVPTT